jgi:hypothetical protein
VAFNVDHPRVMEQPVEDRRGDDCVAEELLPVDEAFVRGQDRRALFVAAGDELEKQIRLSAVDGQIPGFVDDDEPGAVVGLALALGLLELADQRLHGREVDPDAVAEGLDRQGGRQMGLSDAGWTEEKNVFVARKEGQVEKLHDGLLVEMRVEEEVVLLDRLGERQTRDLQGRLDAALLPGGHFLFEQMIQEREIGTLVFISLCGDGLEHLHRPDELEPRQVVLEAFAGQLVHATPPRAYSSYSASER